jgi:hypothetical protein
VKFPHRRKRIFCDEHSVRYKLFFPVSKVGGPQCEEVQSQKKFKTKFLKMAEEKELHTQIARQAEEVENNLRS